MATSASRLRVDELKQRLDRGAPVILVDSRSEHAYETSSEAVPGAIRVPPDRSADVPPTYR